MAVAEEIRMPWSRRQRLDYARPQGLSLTLLTALLFAELAPASGSIADSTMTGDAHTYTEEMSVRPLRDGRFSGDFRLWNRQTRPRLLILSL